MLDQCYKCNVIALQSSLIKHHVYYVIIHVIYVRPLFVQIVLCIVKIKMEMKLSYVLHAKLINMIYVKNVILSYQNKLYPVMIVTKKYVKIVNIAVIAVKDIIVMIV